MIETPKGFDVSLESLFFFFFELHRCRIYVFYMCQNWSIYFDASDGLTTLSTQ